MARDRSPILKKCRTLGISPTVMGINKSTNRNPNANSRRKVSDYGLQLKEKQKVKFIYGVLEKQFAHYFDMAEKKEGITGENLLATLESRLDNVIFRVGLSSTRREARQLVVHGHYTVNGRRVNIPSYLVKPGDVISLHEKSRKSEKFKMIAETTAGQTTPKWLDMDKNTLTAKVLETPSREDIDFEVEEHQIVELYSK